MERTISKERIDPERDTEEEVNSFLMEKYTYGLWEFASSVSLIFTLYNEKKRYVVYRHIKENITRLKKIKMDIIMKLDDLLNEMGFYELTKKTNASEKIEWTTQKRKDYIGKHYKLNPFHSVIDEQIKKYEDLKILFKPTLDKKMKEFPYTPMLPGNIEPLRLLVMTWGFVMTKANRRDWINMALLLKWFIKRFKKLRITDLFCLEKYSLNYSLEDLFRLYWRRQSKLGYGFLAIIIYYASFRQQKEERGKSQPLNILKDLSTRMTRSVEELKEMVDAFVLEEMIIPS